MLYMVNVLETYDIDASGRSRASQKDTHVACYCGYEACIYVSYGHVISFRMLQLWAYSIAI